MRHALLAALLVATLTGPTLGAPSVELPYKLVADSVPAPWFSTGTVAGRFGGVPVSGSFQGTSVLGILTLTVHKATFAFGSYACARRACTFTGTVAGLRVKGIALPMNIRGTGRMIVQALPTRRAWISSVTSWARQHLHGDERDRIIADAEKVPGS